MMFYRCGFPALWVSACASALYWITKDLASLSLDTLAIKCCSWEQACPLQGEKALGRRRKKHGAERGLGSGNDLSLLAGSWEPDVLRRSHPSQFRYAPNTPKMQESHVVTFWVPSVPSSWTLVVHVFTRCTDSWDMWVAENWVGVRFYAAYVWGRLKTVRNLAVSCMWRFI